MTTETRSFVGDPTRPIGRWENPERLMAIEQLRQIIENNATEISPEDQITLDRMTAGSLRDDWWRFGDFIRRMSQMFDIVGRYVPQPSERDLAKLRRIADRSFDYVQISTDSNYMMTLYASASELHRATFWVGEFPNQRKSEDTSFKKVEGGGEIETYFYGIKRDADLDIPGLEQGWYLEFHDSTQRVLIPVGAVTEVKGLGDRTREEVYEDARRMGRM